MRKYETPEIFGLVVSAVLTDIRETKLIKLALCNPFKSDCYLCTSSCSLHFPLRTITAPGVNGVANLLLYIRGIWYNSLETRMGFGHT